MEWIINQLRVHPELAIFLTLFAGFWLGRLKIGKFSLGQEFFRDDRYHAVAPWRGFRHGKSPVHPP